MVIKPLSFTESNLIELLIDHKSIHADEGVFITTSMICPLVLNLISTVVVHLGLTTPLAELRKMASCWQWLTLGPHKMV